MKSQAMYKFLVYLLLVVTSRAFRSQPLGRTTFSVRPSLVSSSKGSRNPTFVAAEKEGIEQPKPPVKCPNCDKCDGSGRILGGIAVVLPWWPIKAYRPCPNFIANGGFYERSGQGLDEIAFGRDSTYQK